MAPSYPLTPSFQSDQSSCWPASGKTIPSRLTRDAERLSDRRPAHLALAQRMDRLLQRRPRIVEDDALDFQPAQQPVGLHLGHVLETHRRRRVAGRLAEDVVTEAHAFIADEHAGAGDEPRDVVLALAAERAIERRTESLPARPRQPGRHTLDRALKRHGFPAVKSSLTVKLSLTYPSRAP